MVKMIDLIPTQGILCIEQVRRPPLHGTMKSPCTTTARQVFLRERDTLLKLFGLVQHSWELESH